MLKSFYKQKQTIIKVTSDGSFKDTVRAFDGHGYHGLYIGDVFHKVYFQNGDEITMTVDVKNFDKTLQFSGNGTEETHFIQKFYNTLDFIHDDSKISLYDLSETDFTTKINYHFTNLNDLLLKDKTLDSTFIVKQQKEIDHVLKNIKETFKEKAYIKKELGKGKVSPTFTNYINYKGGTTSLNDLKGKYVYIDFWDIWCKPCIAEFPSLKKLIKKYHSKKIEFVSIALMTEDSKEWKDFITEKKLKGTQLLMTKDKSFREAYKVSGIPRYILIDNKGNIVSQDAPRPSDPKLVELFNSLDI